MKKNIAIILVLSCSLRIQGFPEKYLKSTCYSNKFGEAFPDDICLLKNFLEKAKNICDGRYQKAWFFCGLPESKKTRALQFIAEESNTPLYFYTAKSIADSKDSKNITSEVDRIYKNAEDVANNNNKTILIVIDEIDLLDKDQAKELSASLKSQIDRVKDNPYIVTIITGNNISRIDDGLLSRCSLIK